MTPIRMLRLEFNASIPPDQLPDFRHAVTDFLGFTGNYIFEGDWSALEKDWLGLHDEKAFSCLLSYPLIQFKWDKGAPQRRLQLMAIGDRTDRIARAFDTGEDHLVANGGIAYMLEAEKKQDTVVSTGQIQAFRKYKLSRYIPCTGIEGKDLLRCDSIHQRYIVERSLSRHILLFLLAVGVELETPLEIYNLRLSQRAKAPIMGSHTPFFDLEFSCNLQLPPLLGLGCKAELGYGLLQ
jgi:hypothetical protein